jgi:hypothetical protein
LQDPKPRDWADRGTATGGTPKAPIKSTGATQSAPSSATVKQGVHTSGTVGRKGYPKLSK